MKVIRVSLTTVLACLLLATVSYGASEPFFKDKTVRVIVFATPGGGYDFYARLLGRYMAKHLAGNPTVIVQNMPIGQQAANTLGRSKPDGLTWATLSREGYLGNIAGDRSLKYDFSKGIPIGSVADENSVIYIRTDTGITTLKQLKSALKAGKTIRRRAEWCWPGRAIYRARSGSRKRNWVSAASRSKTCMSFITRMKTAAFGVRHSRVFMMAMLFYRKRRWRVALLCQFRMYYWRLKRNRTLPTACTCCVAISTS